ncbi:DNA topoisomerase [Clostridia bacterium]|nr:DNA topoisomerase [Clostridia bacterium]
MKTLIIAEKSSVGNAIAAALGINGGYNTGYIESADYVISWCKGHLLELAMPENYDAKYKNWRYTDLPIFPKDWQYNVTKDGERQLLLLNNLLNRADIDVVVNACDAGREGELIFRLVYNHCKCRKAVKRLWVSSMEEKAIAEGLKHLKNGYDYDNLCRSAVCREQADWLVGCNESRLFSIVYGEKYNVGRVQTPTLNMIVERENAINGFVKKPFYYAEIEVDNLIAASEKYDDKVVVDEIVRDCRISPVKVISVERKEKSILPPKLYDLTTLQREANRKYGYTAAQTLDYAQSLYEKKLATYPRTDSRFLADDMADSAAVLIGKLNRMSDFGGYVPDCLNIGNVLDSTKVSDHTAILPTEIVSAADFNKFPTGEKNILTMLIFRLISAVCGKYVYEETTVNLECAGTKFKTVGKSVINLGWKAVEGREKNETETFIPKINENENLTVTSATLKEGFTAPPKRFTDDTLLSAMETAGDFSDVPDVERRGIGTPATRSNILERLIKSGYIERDKKNFVPTEKAKTLIALLPDNVKSPQMTAEWEEKLKAVERGEMPPDVFMDGIKTMISDTIKVNNTVKAGEIVGKCPRCDKDIYENEHGFFCSNLVCDFALFKNSKFWKDKQAELTTEIVREFLEKGNVYLPALYSPKTGRIYSATITMEAGDSGFVNFKMTFGKK